tara:strand:+ start:54 stop:371 length:318 start_codon:yes stop_codon:yes gene_type:complete
MKRRSKKSQLIGLLNQLGEIAKMGIKFSCYQCGKFEHGYGFNIWVPDWCMDCIIAKHDGVVAFYTDDEKDQAILRIRKGDWPKLKGEKKENDKQERKRRDIQPDQ